MRWSALLLLILPLAASAVAHALDLGPETRASVGQLLDDYERIRAALAADEIAAVVRPARSLATLATGAAGAAPADAAPHLRAVATAATALASVPAHDAAAVRRAFGDLSRPLVALLDLDPALRAGRHVFECPMADGYRKWIQTSPRIANPYMGTRMLVCGRPSTWAP